MSSTTLPNTLETALKSTSNTPPYQSEHLEHRKITFEILTHHDLEHIDNLHNFNKLLQKMANVMNYDATAPAAGQLANEATTANPQSTILSTTSSLMPTNAEISKSVVLDLADLKSQSDYEFNFERFFNGADMHSIINYLWIGVVTSLIILSVIFIVFSCYFYRKFRQWKKCNKDIRGHVSSESNCSGNNNVINGAAYYQLESPPCYTIATGLPSYDEALLHHHQHQQQHYYNYAYKFMYPRLAAKHQQQLQLPQENMTSLNENFIGNCEKSATSLTSALVTVAGNNLANHKMLHFFKNEQITKNCNNYVKQHQQPQQQQQQQHQNNIKVSTLLS